MSAEIERLTAMVLAHDDIYTKTAIAFDDFLLAIYAAGIPDVTEPCCIRGFWHVGAAIELRRKADVLEMKHLMELAYPAGIAGNPILSPLNAPEFLSALKANTNPISHPIYKRKLVNLLVRAYRIPIAEGAVVAANSDAAVDAAYGNPLADARAAIYAKIPAAGVEAPPAAAGAGATCVESPELADLVGIELPEQTDKAFRTARKKFVMHVVEAIRMIRESCRPPIALATSHDRIIRFEPMVKPKSGNAGRAAFNAKSEAATKANRVVFESLRPPFSETGSLREAEARLRKFDSELIPLKRVIAEAARQLAAAKRKGNKEATAIAEGTLASVTASYEETASGRPLIQEQIDLEKRMKALADFFSTETSDTKRRETRVGPHFSYFYLMRERLADISLYVATVSAASASASTPIRAAVATSGAAAAALQGRALSANIANSFKPGAYPKFINAGMTLPNGASVTKQLFLAPAGSRRNGDRIIGPNGNPYPNAEGWLVAGNHGIAEGGARRSTRRHRSHRRARKTRRHQ